MRHSITAWRYSRPPNYNTSINKIYPYSEVPFIGQYNLVKIPLSLNNLLEHVDYWGEGRIITEVGNSGFVNCYNVNHEYQLVSNGPDSDRKIPNRVPVISYTNCDTSSYIKDNSVKLVTLMGSPINKRCAKDIARMINTDIGKVVIYGFDSKQADVENLDEELKLKGLIYCETYDLPEVISLANLTLFNNYRAYINLTEISDVLYKNITTGKYETAVNITKTLHNTYNGVNIVDVVTKLLRNGVKNIMEYAYKLWNNDGKEIVKNYFPVPFKSIFDEGNIKFIDKKYLLPLKVDVNLDSYNDRAVWGDASDKSINRLKWKVVPIWEKNNTVSFKIMNLEYNVFLKLDVTTDEYGDRKAWGSNVTNEQRFLWGLEPIKVDDDLLFYIINKQYNQGLKLDVNADYYGDRLLWGHNGSQYGNPGNFGWFIAPLP